MVRVWWLGSLIMSKHDNDRTIIKRLVLNFHSPSLLGVRATSRYATILCMPMMSLILNRRD